MNTHNIYDKVGRRAGYLNEMSDVIYAHDSKGIKVGYYNKNTDTTFDRNGRRFGSGNLIASLIMTAHQNNR